MLINEIVNRMRLASAEICFIFQANSIDPSQFRGGKVTQVHGILFSFDGNTSDGNG